MHDLLMFAYLICPIAMLAIAIRARRPGRVRPLARFSITALLGLFAGSVCCSAYAYVLHAKLIFTQVLITSYAATSLILFMQLFDRFLWIVSRWLLKLDTDRKFVVGYDTRAAIGLLLRSAVVFCLGLPFVLAVLLTYRPKVETVDDPGSVYQWYFQPVNFSAAVDGTNIAGWWIPTTAKSPAGTVILCPDLDADKAKQLFLAKRLLPAGYNILVFDFRGHGHSGGQLCSFGDLERRDVLGAVRWVRQTLPADTHKIVGLGIGDGGAALLAAAADNSVEGRSIDAVAVFGTYDRLDRQADSLINLFIPNPLSWCVKHIGLPAASLQVGTDLRKFSPQNDITKLWPRPVLVMHEFDDQLVPFERGQALFDAAQEPKQNFWITPVGHSEAQRNDAAAQCVKRYFDAAAKLI